MKKQRRFFQGIDISDVPVGKSFTVMGGIVDPVRDRALGRCAELCDRLESFIEDSSIHVLNGQEVRMSTLRSLIDHVHAEYGV